MNLHPPSETPERLAIYWSPYTNPPRNLCPTPVWRLPSRGNPKRVAGEVTPSPGLISEVGDRAVVSGPPPPRKQGMGLGRAQSPVLTGPQDSKRRSPRHRMLGFLPGVTGSCIPHSYRRELNHFLGCSWGRAWLTRGEGGGGGICAYGHRAIQTPHCTCAVLSSGGR